MTQSAVIIVTGAGGGVGRALCERLAREGCRLVLVGRTEAKLLETLEGVARMGGDRASNLILAVDVSNPAAADSVIEQTIQKWGRIDAIVNNAAILQLTPFEMMDARHLQETFAANTFAPAALVSACWPTFAKQRFGRIVNVSSVATLEPFPGLAAYAASKAALESLTRSIVVEGKHLGMLAFNVLLGGVETSMLRSVVNQQQYPVERTLTPDEAADAIAQFALGRRDVDAGKPIVVARR